MLDFPSTPHYGIGRLHGHNPFQPNECALPSAMTHIEAPSDFAVSTDDTLDD